MRQTVDSNPSEFERLVSPNPCLSEIALRSIDWPGILASCTIRLSKSKLGLRIARSGEKPQGSEQKRAERDLRHVEKRLRIGESQAFEPLADHEGYFGMNCANRARMFLILLIFGLYGPQARAATSVESFCPTPAPVTLSQSPSCRVRFRTGPGENLCIPGPLWSTWLARSESGPLCGPFRGAWKAASAPLNDPGPRPEGSKILVTRFVAKALPQESAKKDRGETSLGLRLWRWLESTREAASASLSLEDPLGIARHLLLGESLGNGPGSLLRLLGFVHILTATGIHLYALATIWSFLLSRIFGQLGIPVGLGLCLRRIFVFITWCSAWILSGAPAGMLRPWIVVSARSLSSWQGFRWRKAAPLLIALLAEGLWSLLRDGLSGSSFVRGRLIYALAVGGGLLVIQEGSKNQTPLRTHFRLALGSWVFPALWEAWGNATVAVATPLLSCLTLPVFSLVLYPALLTSVILRVCGLGMAAGAVSQFSARSITGLTLGLCGLLLRIPSLWIVSRGALYLGGVAASLLLIRRRRQASFKIDLGVAVTLFVVRVAADTAFHSVALRAPLDLPLRSTSVEQLDVGQGDSALVRAPDQRAGLIDAGSGHALPDGSWITLFAQRGITDLSWIGLTHLDEDHSGGALRLARLLPIACVSVSHDELDTPRGGKYQENLSRLGVSVTDETAACVPFPTLSPLPAGKSARRRKQNAHMSAYFVPLQGGGFYLSAGDAEGDDELRIGNWARRLGRGEPEPRVLKISHHGSKTSSDPRFFAQVRPSETWISVGAGNSYGHPSAIVLERLVKLGVPVRRTDRDGALAIRGAAGPRPPRTHRP